MGALIFVLLLLVAALAVLSTYFYQRVNYYRHKFAPVVEIDDEVQKAKNELARLNQEQNAFITEYTKKRDQLAKALELAKGDYTKKRGQLNAEYEKAKVIYTRLQHEISLLEENLEDISFGLYKPHFDFKTPEGYKRKLEELRDREKSMIRDGQAAVCTTEWTVGGSKKEGARMTKQNSKLILRAFNGECDAALANVSWNNIVKMEDRIRHTRDAINKLGSVMNITITDEYLELKLGELRLAYELEEKKYEEREEQKRLREQIREEERARREIEEAKEEAEREEERYMKALEVAKAEAARATGDEMLRLSGKVKELESKLEEAHKDKERAMSRAQMTKSGHVYVISNVGSFGDNVYKIGMTRRLEPQDRVDELGDASVPFPFDVHAMIYSENAPELEYNIHNIFKDRRINLVNTRREFYNVRIDEIEELASRLNIKIDLTRIAEAKEYRESLAIRKGAANSEEIKLEPVPAREVYSPPDLFSEEPPPLPEPT